MYKILSFIVIICLSLNFNSVAQLSIKPIVSQSTNPNLVSSIGKNSQEFVEEIDPHTDRKRLGIRYFPWTDFVPSGFYIAAGKELQIEAQNTIGNKLPTIIIGTYNYNDEKKPQTVALKAGLNTIKAEKGGLIWVRYNSPTPNSKAILNFKSGYVKAPTFIKGVDNTTSWKQQLEKSAAPEVILLGNRIIQMYSLAYAKSIQSEDLNFVLQTADNIWDWQNEFSGMDGSSPKHKLPVHNRILMVESFKTTVGCAYAYSYGTAYSESCSKAAFTAEIAKNGWGTWHELGHEHQQYMWTNNLLTEVTVNLYTLHIERKLGIKNGRLRVENLYIPAIEFLKDTNPNKDFTTMTGTYNDHFTRLVMFQQLYLAFGEKFYPEIHKKARLEDKGESLSDMDKLKWFAKAACQVSGRDLSHFFQQWGFRLGTAFYQEIADLKLPKPSVEPSTLVEDQPLLSLPYPIASELKSNVPYVIVSAITNKHGFDFNQSLSMYAINGGKHQQWTIKPTKDGFFQIINQANPQIVIEAKGNTVGAIVGAGKNENGDHQQWKRLVYNTGEVVFTPKSAPDLYIDFADINVGNGVKPILNTKPHTNTQKFYFLKVE